MRLECEDLFKAYPNLVLSAQTPALCFDSQRRLLVTFFPFPCAMGRHELLDTAKALLVEALKMAEKLLDGFPIPAAKGTIGAVLHFIAEAEVCTRMKLCYFSTFIASQRTAANAGLCDELREHILGLHNQLIQPLVGKKEDDIPHGTLAALKDFTGYVALFHLGAGF